jgi:outer membrane protein OmpA-like peptidoglycan-associated protein
MTLLIIALLFSQQPAASVRPESAAAKPESTAAAPAGSSDQHALGEEIIKGETEVKVEDMKPYFPPEIDPFSPVKDLLAPESYVLDDALYHSVDSMTIPQYFAHSSYLRNPTERNFIYGDMIVFLPAFEQRVTDWDLQVSNSLGETVRRIARRGQPPAFITWDGTTDTGEPIAPGEVYSFTFNAYDAQGNQTRIPGTPQRVNGIVQEVNGEWVVSIAADQVFAEDGAQLLEQATLRLDEAANVVKEKFKRQVVVYVYSEMERLSAERCRVIEAELSRRIVLPAGTLGVVPRFVTGLQPKLSKIEIHIL